jgi:hypothetical protein
MPLLEPISVSQRLERLSATFPQERLEWHKRLEQLLGQTNLIDDPWLWTCTAHTIGMLAASGEPLPTRLIDAMAAKLRSNPKDPLQTETVLWALNRFAAVQPATLSRYHLDQINLAVTPSSIGDNDMLSTLEKVIFLKSVNLFKDTPDEILTQLATLLEEVEFPAGITIFEKDSPGDCMYIIVTGQVAVQDGGHLLNDLSQGDVFGEMALLDSRTRLASVTTVTATHLLRLDQEPFYELMEDHIQVARGVISVLSGYLRDLLPRVSRLQSESPSFSEF